MLELCKQTRRALDRNLKAEKLLDSLFINPYITVARAREILKVSHPTAGQAIAALQRVNVLREVTGRSWGHVFVSDPILNAIEKPRSM